MGRVASRSGGRKNGGTTIASKGSGNGGVRVKERHSAGGGKRELEERGKWEKGGIATRVLGPNEKGVHLQVQHLHGRGRGKP